MADLHQGAAYRERLQGLVQASAVPRTEIYGRLF